MDHGSSDDFTLMLNRASNGDVGATNAVWSRAYRELHGMARGVRPGIPAQSAVMPTPTEIIHEAFVKVFRSNSSDASWDSRAHFFGSITRAMTQFVVDWRRAGARSKRGGGQRIESFGGSELSELVQAAGRGGGDRIDSGCGDDEDDDFTDAAVRERLLDALDWLRIRAPELADVVCIRYMASLSLEDASLVLGISPRTVSKRWNLGRAMLRRRMRLKRGESRREQDSFDDSKHHDTPS